MVDHPHPDPPKPPKPPEDPVIRRLDQIIQMLASFQETDLVLFNDIIVLLNDILARLAPPPPKLLKHVIVFWSTK